MDIDVKLAFAGQMILNTAMGFAERVQNQTELTEETVQGLQHELFYNLGRMSVRLEEFTRLRIADPAGLEQLVLDMIHIVGQTPEHADAAEQIIGATRALYEEGGLVDVSDEEDGGDEAGN